MRSLLRFMRHPAHLGGLVLGLGLTIATPALAESKIEVLSVTASSTDGMLMDAVDGDTSTAWQNKRAGERDAWLAVHFADEAKLKGVHLQLDALGADTAIDVESSGDGEAYSPVMRGQHALKDRLDLTFAKPVTAQFLRVRFHYTGKGTAPRFRIKELEAF